MSLKPIIRDEQKIDLSRILGHTTVCNFFHTTISTLDHQSCLYSQSRYQKIVEMDFEKIGFDNVSLENVF